MKALKKILIKLSFLTLVILLIAILAIIIFFLTLSVSLLSLGFIIKKFNPSGEDIAMDFVGAAALSFWLSALSVLLSLVPFYKITLSLANFFEKRGWKIENPHHFFFLSLVILLILFFFNKIFLSLSPL